MWSHSWWLSKLQMTLRQSWTRDSELEMMWILKKRCTFTNCFKLLKACHPTRKFWKITHWLHVKSLHSYDNAVWDSWCANDGSISTLICVNNSRAVPSITVKFKQKDWSLHCMNDVFVCFRKMQMMMQLLLVLSENDMRECSRRVKSKTAKSLQQCKTISQKKFSKAASHLCSPNTSGEQLKPELAAFCFHVSPQESQIWSPRSILISAINKVSLYSICLVWLCCVWAGLFLYSVQSYCISLFGLCFAMEHWLAEI